jgi:hypothetical protein
MTAAGTTRDQPSRGRGGVSSAKDQDTSSAAVRSASSPTIIHGEPRGCPPGAMTTIARESPGGELAVVDE